MKNTRCKTTAEPIHHGLPGAGATWANLRAHLPSAEIPHIVAFLNSLDSTRSQETYLYGLKRFVGSGGGSLLRVTSGSLRTWAQAAELGQTTLKSTLTALRSFYNHVAAQIPGFTNPFTCFTVRLHQVRDTESIGIAEKVLSIDQIRLVIARLEAEEVRIGREVPGAFLFRFLAMTGMRISEALSLNFFDPRKEGVAGYVNYLRPDGEGRYVARVLGKAHRLREVHLSEELGQAITKRFPPGVARPGEPVFTTHDSRHTRLGRHGAYSEAKNIAKRFMADFPGGMRKRFGWHCLRHSLCTHLLVTAGEDPSMVARAMGHSPAVLARFYLHGTRDIFKGLRLLG